MKDLFVNHLNEKKQAIDEILEKHKKCNNQIVIMADRKDTLYLSNINNSIDANITFTEDIIKNVDLSTYFPNITNKSVVQFLLQKYICEKADVFIGYEGSTVSHHIQYINYIQISVIAFSTLSGFLQSTKNYFGTDESIVSVSGIGIFFISPPTILLYSAFI